MDKEPCLLPFPQPDTAAVETTATEFQEMNTSHGYSRELAVADAMAYLTIRSAVASGFIEELTFTPSQSERAVFHITKDGGV